MTKEKLQQAGVVAKPYFAAVNALDAIQLESDSIDIFERAEILRARRDMKTFLAELHQLGAKVSEPMLMFRQLCLIVDNTQQAVNYILRDNEDARILNAG